MHPNCSDITCTTTSTKNKPENRRTGLKSRFCFFMKRPILTSLLVRRHLLSTMIPQNLRKSYGILVFHEDSAWIGQIWQRGRGWNNFPVDTPRGYPMATRAEALGRKGLGDFFGRILADSATRDATRRGFASWVSSCFQWISLSISQNLRGDNTPLTANFFDVENKDNRLF